LPAFNLASIDPGGDNASSAWKIPDADAARHPTLDTAFSAHHNERVRNAAKGPLRQDPGKEKSPPKGGLCACSTRSRGHPKWASPQRLGLGGQTSQDAPTTVTTHVASPPFTVGEHT